MKDNHKLWMIPLVIILGALVVLNMAPSSQIVCNKPYILVGTSCCLDENNNSICDKDEIATKQKAIVGVSETQEQKIENPSTGSAVSNVDELKKKTVISTDYATEPVNSGNNNQ